MDVYFSRYALTPRRKINHLATLKAKSGVYLKIDQDGEIADYFPHESMGDESVEDFLENFPKKQNAYHLNILRQLEAKKVPLPTLRFFNHQLWQDGASLEAPVVKYKIMHKEDQVPDEILRSRCRIRLDANGLFEGKDIFKFLSRMDIQQIARIDYIEDPSVESSWSDIPIPTAQDFIENKNFRTLIYKPNRNYIPSLPPGTIFSGYMGSSLGSLHAYRELIARGDLALYHGLYTPQVYEEEPEVFQGDFDQGFAPDEKSIKILFERIHDGPWSKLCSL